MSRNRLIAVTCAMMLSLFMASMEGTVIATAMPTIVSELGGIEIYSWAFSVYMLTSTTTVPIFGKLSDIYGRRLIYAISITLFLAGSWLCGLAQTMGQLIAFRAIQGLGAGGLLTLTFIVIGDIFTLEQRARIQGVFSSVWGISSIIGPLLGGFLVDQVSWPWVFWVNIPPGLLAIGVFWNAWVRRGRDKRTRPAIDYAGAVLLTAAVVALLLGLFQVTTPLGWLLLAIAAVLFGGLALVERRAADPVLPLPLFRDRLFVVACLHGMLAGCALFGSTAFIPLFVQAVLGTSATAAGATLTPMSLAWVLTSIVSSRLLLRVSYRSLAIVGMVLLTVGSVLLLQTTTTSGQFMLLFSTSLMGSGMGCSVPAFLIAVQSSVERRVLGTATSTLQFMRSIGGTLGVSVMGLLLSLRLAASLAAAGMDPGGVTLAGLLDPVGEGSAPALDATLRTALAGSIQSVFVIAFIASALGLLATFWAPRGQVSQLEARQRTGEAVGSLE